MFEASIVFALSGVVLGLMIIVALLIRRDANRRANRMLAGSLACTMIYLVSMIFTHSDAFEGSRVLSLMAYIYFAGVPLLYAYAKLMTAPTYQLKLKDSLHLLPTFLVLVMISLGLAEGMHVTPENLAEARSGWASPLAWVSMAVYVVPIAYLFGVLSLIRTHRETIAGIFSFEEKVALRWLKLLVNIYLAFAFGGLVLAVARLIPGVELWPRSLYSMSMIIAIYYVIAFIGVSQPVVFAPRSEEYPKKTEEIPESFLLESPLRESPLLESSLTESPLPESSLLESSLEIAAEERQSPLDSESSPPLAAKYETSTLYTVDIEAHWTHLLDIMEQQKPYLDNELRVMTLAEITEMPAHHLSQTINQQSGKSFFEFINQYRVEEAKKRLEQAETSMVAIAFEAGFNSQSAFYRQFKKLAGMTPKQYQRQVLTELS